MKKNICHVFVLLIVIALCGCIDDGDSWGDVDDTDAADAPNAVEDQVMPVYEGEGDWPEYAGGWMSINPAAGSKNADRAYLEVTLHDDGTFDGTYEGYVYSYTWNMPTAWGPIPTPIYIPSGDKKAIRGVINFDTLSGTLTMEDIGETDFELEILADDELAIVFPDDFTYSAINIQR